MAGMTTAAPNYTLEALEEMPTLTVGQTDDLKVDTGTERVWLARTIPADGERHRHRVSHETLTNGRWIVTQEYEAPSVFDRL